jgi:hypothetical protein
MKGFIVILLISFISLSLTAQVDLSYLSIMLDQNPRKLEQQLQKKGFNREHHFSDRDIRFVHQTLADSQLVNRHLQLKVTDDSWELIYKTPSADEFLAWQKEINANCQSFSRKDQPDHFYLPRQNITIKCDKEKEDTTTLYTITTYKKNLPKAKDLMYAEDLLAIDAHVYLEAVFGSGNVKEDRFFFSENLSKKCSIIFPNTSRQAIFLWGDEDNLKDLQFVIIGEPASGGETRSINQMTLPVWKSKQGIFCGMNIKEIEKINGDQISFYKWRSPLAGTMALGNKGNLDFNKIEIVLDCMNCSFVPAKSGTEIINGSLASELNQKWYVQSFAVVKEQNKPRE